MDNDLILMHDQLTERFGQLRDSRLSLGRPVYLLEHGLGSDELDAVTGQLQHALNGCPLDGSTWWQQRFLPLLVVACEVGYEYRGNGTDYWPLLEQCLESQFSYEQRQCVSAYFKRCQTTLACIKPPDTDWARSFCHIVWPITNAVLPLDMRLPFAQALCRVSGRICRETDDATILRMISGASVDSWSQRFDSWARTERLVADLARDFLEDGYPVAYLDVQTRDRVVRDLHQDASVRRELRLARQRQRRVRTGGPQENAEILSPLKGRLFLTRKSLRSFALEGETPLLSQQLRKSISSVLRSGQWSIQPWGLQDVLPLPPSALLHGTRFNVPLRDLQEFTADQAFLTDLEKVPLQSSEREFLARLKFDLRLPMVFSPDDNDSATQRLNRRLTAGEQIWLLVLAENVPSPHPSGVVELGTVAMCQVVTVDLSATEAGEWVQSIGLAAPADYEWEWLLPPALNPGEEPPSYLSGDSVVLRFRRWPPRQASLRAVHVHNGQTAGELTIDAPRLIEIPTTASGRHEVMIETDAGLSEQLRFDIVQESDADGCDVPLIQLSLRSPELSASSLSRGELSLEIASTRKFENLTVEVALSYGAKPLSATLDELPGRLESGHEIWEKLLTAEARESIARGRDAELAVRVGNLAERTWLLENQVDELWWEWSDTSVRALRDSGEAPVKSLPLNNLLGPLCPADETFAHADTRLCVSCDERGPLYEAGGLLLTPCEMEWPADLPRFGRVLRQLDDRDDGVGLRKLSSLYLAMANATSAHLVAEMYRRRYAETLLKCVLEVCCGDRWVQRLDRNRWIEVVEPLKCFWKAALKAHAGFQEDLLPSRDREEHQFFQAVRPCLKQLLPNGWWRLPTSSLTDDDGELLDKAFIEAYRTVSESIESTDPERAQQWRAARYFTPTEKWQQAMTEACLELNGAFLADLIFPAAGGEFLLNFSLGGLDLPELAELLEDWRRRFLPRYASSTKWTAEVFEACLALQLRTKRIRKLPVEQGLRGMLSDRLTARAIAFVAWRARQFERLCTPS